MPPVPDLQRIETVTIVCSLRNRSSKFGLERMLSLPKQRPSRESPALSTLPAPMEKLYYARSPLSLERIPVGLYTSRMYTAQRTHQIDRKPFPMRLMQAGAPIVRDR